MVTRVGATAPRTLTSSEPTLRQGSSGSAVVKLQQELAKAGFSAGSADGSFGPKTLAAVKRFQSAHGLTADGIVGPRTWAALDKAATPAPPPPSSGGSHPTLKLGSKGSAVTEMQRDLTKAGVPCTADGSFGPATLAALKKFQSAHGLTADGVCGPKTWAALTSGVFTPPPPKPSTDPVLRPGASGAAVIKLQQLLNKSGAHLTVDGQFGPGTESAVIQYQASRGLSADGIVGAQTWGALERGAPPVSNPPPTGNGSLRQRILDVARSQIGTLETGNNQGPCLKYPNYFGRGSEAWCADFASWVLTHAGKSFNNSYCPSIVSNAKHNGTWKGKSNPQPGDLVLFDWNGDGVSDHVGIVERVNSNGTITTIEGNSDKPGTSQSGVWEHTRTYPTIMGFVNVG